MTHRPHAAAVLGILFVSAIGCDEPKSPDRVVAELRGCVGRAPAAALPQGGGTRVEPALAGGFAIHRGLTPPRPGPLALGDCDGDGTPELVATWLGRLYRVTGGAHLDEIPGGAALREAPSSAAAFADLDGDGDLDLLTAGDALLLHANRGDCTFEPPVPLVTLAGGSPRQVQIADVDEDGLADVIVGHLESRRVPFTIARARGDGAFEPIEAAAPPSHRAGGYVLFGTAWEDVDGDGRNDLFALLDGGDSWFAWGAAGTDDPTGTTRDEALSALIAVDSPMSLSALDLDRDGRMDWFLAGSNDRNMLLWSRGGRGLVDVGCEVGTSGGAGEAVSYWSSLAFDLDRDGWTDVLALRHGDEAVRPDHRRVPLRPALYVNRRDGTFADLGPALLPVELASEIAVCADLDGGGRPSCFVTEDEDGVLLLENELRPAGDWVGVRLRGTLSPPTGAGARVSLDGVSPPLVVAAGPQSSTQALHATDVVLPAAGATAVTVTWPSGIVQKATELPPGRYTTIVEPRALRLSARVVPADGRSTVEVIADPAAAGAARAELLLAGDGAWVGPAEDAGGGTVRRTLRAPIAPGAARITLLLDGKPLRTRPLVRFE